MDKIRQKLCSMSETLFTLHLTVSYMDELSQDQRDELFDLIKRIEDDLQNVLKN